jgi:serine protease DegQ
MKKLLSALFVLGCVQIARAALPPAIDGQALPSLAPMLERITPAVVNVHSQTRVQVRDPFFDDPFFRRFFQTPDRPQERIQQSLGSGVIVDAARGLLLTNNHVVDGATEISVTLFDGRTLDAKIVGTDPDTDVAVIKVAPQNLTAVSWGNSDGLRVGDFVVAVGNPFGLGQTATSGIVSALGRSGLNGLGYQNFIQTDASINPGNSGGALVNLKGELIGLNSAIYSPSGGNVGIGFAIPSTLARSVMQQLLAHGEVQRGSIGLSAQDLDPALAKAMGMTGKFGAVITGVVPESAAAKAGIKRGDVVISLAGKPIHSANELSNAEGLLPLNQLIDLQAQRGSQLLNFKLSLVAVKLALTPAEKLDERLGGAKLSDLTAGQKQKGQAGVMVAAVEPNSRAGKAGLQRGDVIAGINRYAITNLAQLSELLAQKPSNYVLTIFRGEQRYVLQVQ